MSFNSNFYGEGKMVFSTNSSGTKRYPHETELSWTPALHYLKKLIQTDLKKPKCKS